MDHGGEALVGFVGTHGDAFELLELAKEVLDEVTPFVAVWVDPSALNAAGVLRDDDGCTALVEIGDDGVAVERLVGDQAILRWLGLSAQARGLDRWTAAG